MNDISPAPTRDEYAASSTGYLRAGAERAMALDNRGPLRRDRNGKVHPDILDAYWKHGFYIFEDVIGADELDELRADADMMVGRAPVRPGADVDARGRPALGRDYAREPYTLIRPLSDPWGGTGKLNGRHPAQMTQPTPDADAPDYVVFLMYGMCQAMPAALRVYGHPSLLTVAEGINGPDFVPFNDAVFVKQPGVGGSVAWHQDGVTPLGLAGLGHGQSRFQLPGPALSHHTRQLPVGGTGNPQARPGRHQGPDCGKRRRRKAPGRGAAAVPAGRCHGGQPADAACVLRQHLARHAALGNLRVPSPPFCDRPARRTQHERLGCL